MAADRHLRKFKWRYLSKGSSDTLHVCLYGGVFGVGGSIDRVIYSRLNQVKKAAARHLGKFRMNISGMGYPITLMKKEIRERIMREE